jgi:hypothetical protein
LFLLKQWQDGRFEGSALSSQSTDSINVAVRSISQAVPGPAAAALALESAAAADAQAAEISDELADQIISAGLERFLRRSLHRREHFQIIEQALGSK